MTVDEIVERVQSFSNTDHVVVTGGEPLIHDRVEDLLLKLEEEDYHVTVETNGTQETEAPIDLVSISPKLSNSTPTEENAPENVEQWTEIHEERRIDYSVLAELADNFEIQLKFVVTERSDVNEIKDIVSNTRDRTESVITQTDVLIMPEGVTKGQVSNTREIAAEVALQEGYRYTPRLHVNIWNDKPGT